MGHTIKQWPEGVYPGEIQAECPEAEATIDVLIARMKAQGPQPDGYQVKSLGQRWGGLWQINLKVQKRQVRVLYAPYGDRIVIFRIHKKSSPQEQKRAYTLALKRKKEYERPRLHYY
jgi:Phage derived protein Gp49-like (DUF891)